MRNVIQVLIVILMLLVCGGIVTSAIVQVRGAAACIQCSNNLKHLALTLGTYQDGYEAFPQAAVTNPDLPPEERLSWIVSIVPYIESSNLYSKIDREKGWDAEENRTAALTSWSIFHCPGYPDQPPVSVLWPTHYLGVTGIGPDAITLPKEDPRAGFFGYDRKLTLADLGRGTSDIMAIAETAHATGVWTAAGPPTSRGLDPNGPPYLGIDGQFGGNHRRGAIVGMADGSVRLVEASVDPAVWEAMATIRPRPE